jgi:hypothetical protein
MGDDESSFQEEHDGSGREPVSGAPDHDRPGVAGHPARTAPGDADLVRREPYLRRVLGAFEAGALEPYDYTRRVLAINATSSTSEMEAIVQQPPEGSGNAVSAGTRGLDPVDLALLRARPSAAARSATTRYVTLALVFVMFAVLIGVGMWLASHVHDAALARLGAGPGLGTVAAPW